MSGLPMINGSGTLCADPELRMTQSGTSVVSLRLAVNNRVFNKETKQYEDGDATFLGATAWKTMAENIAENLRKGQRVVFTGTLKQKNWEKDGQKRSSLEVQIEDIGQSLLFAQRSSDSAQKSEDPWGSAPSW